MSSTKLKNQFSFTVDFLKLTLYAYWCKHRAISLISSSLPLATIEIAALKSVLK
jgi:hypothetical protein